MRVTYDKEVDAAYIYVVDKIGPGEAKKTIPVEADKNVAGMINLDFDKDNRLLGIELIPGSCLLSKKILAKAELLLPRKKRSASK